MTPRRLVLPLLACLSAASPALATGGISCTAQDRSARFAIGSPIGETVGGEFRTRRLAGRVSCSIEG